MKCQTIIDKSRDEEVLIYAHAESSLTREIEALVTAHSTELIGYGERSVITLSPAEVICFTAESDKVYALTDTEQLRIRSRLYTLEEALGGDFVRINQSCIANIKKIKRFEASFGGALLVIFKNGHKDYVSRRQLKAVKERIGFHL